MLKEYINFAATYIPNTGKINKGYIYLSEDFLIFSNSEEVVMKIHKTNISSFQMTNNFFKKNISIRINGENHIFKVKNKSVQHIIHFIKN